MTRLTIRWKKLKRMLAQKQPPIREQTQMDAHAAASQYQMTLDAGWNAYRLATEAASCGLLDPEAMLQIRKQIKEAERSTLRHYAWSLTADQTRCLAFSARLLEDQFERLNAFDLAFYGQSPGAAACLDIRQSGILGGMVKHLQQ